MRSPWGHRTTAGSRAPRGILLAGLALLVSAAVWAAEIPGTASGAGGAGAALDDLLRELRLRQLAPQDETQARRTACQAVLEAFRTGGRMVPAAGTGEGTAPAPESLISGVRTEAGRFGYLAIAAVEPGLATELRKVQPQVCVSAEGGVVVDLRQGGGNGLDVVAESADVLGGWEQPLVVIVGGTTCGASEALAARLRESHGAVLLGEATRGLPYALRPVRLQGGIEVLLPDVPAGARPEPLQPDVPATGRGGGSAASPAGQSLYLMPRVEDLCVRQALDLLTAICAFREKHF